MTRFYTIVVLTLLLSSCGYIRDYQRRHMKLDAIAEGESVLLEAESSKKALIETAKAENEASKMQAEAQVTIAKAQAQVGD